MYYSHLLDRSPKRDVWSTVDANRPLLQSQMHCHRVYYIFPVNINCSCGAFGFVYRIVFLRFSKRKKSIENATENIIQRICSGHTYIHKHTNAAMPDASWCEGHEPDVAWSIVNSCADHKCSLVCAAHAYRMNDDCHFDWQRSTCCAQSETYYTLLVVYTYAITPGDKCILQAHTVHYMCTTTGRLVHIWCIWLGRFSVGRFASFLNWKVEKMESRQWYAAWMRFSGQSIWWNAIIEWCDEIQLIERNSSEID